MMSNDYNANSGYGLTEENEDTNKNRYLTFWTDNQLFGVSISDVVQIIGVQEITPVPEFPNYAKGIINLRGSIIPIIDIRLRFHKPEAEYNERTCIIVTNINNINVGFIVDAVDEVTTIDESQISNPPKMSPKDNTTAYLTGVGKIESKVVLLLDTEKVLSEDALETITKMN